MLHCLKLKLKLHLYTLPKKKKKNKCGIQPSLFTFNTKNNTNILHINIIYQPVEYYYFSKKRIIWMQGAGQGFIKWETAREGGREALCGVHPFVNFGLLFWVVWDAVTNGPLTIYCLTGLLFTQSGWTYQKFCSPAWLALTHSVCVCMYVCVPRPSADSAVRACTERSCLSRPNAF